MKEKIEIIRQKLEAARNLEASEKQRTFLNDLIDNAIVELDKNFEDQVEEDDFDEYFACWSGIEDVDDCWTEEKAIALLGEKLTNISSAINFLKKI